MKVRLSFLFMAIAMFLCIQVEEQTYYELAYKNREERPSRVFILISLIYYEGFQI